ncbi:MAG: ABC-2 family transporter protein [Candidatus Magasanikbacteria bacterium]
MKYTQLFKTFLQRHLAYRARVTIWAFVDLINFLIFPFLWLSIYGDRMSIAGYSRADIVTYYIVIMFISLGFSSHILKQIRTDILNGEINGLLLKPISYLYYRFIHELSYKCIVLLVAVLFFIGADILAPSYIEFPHSWLYILSFFLSLACSYVLSHATQMIVGLSSFWLGENFGPDRLRHILEKIFSGELAPLIFLPGILQTVAVYLPFKYLSYFPSQLYLEQITLPDALNNFFVLGIWIIVSWSIVWIMWKRGLKRYEGVGI